MSSGSMRECVKALNTSFSALTLSYPLPEELCDTIETFLERYENIDDHDSQRFQEDLHALYQRHVAQSPEKRGAFLSLLRLVRPAITGEARLTTWWSLLIKSTIDGIGHKRHEFEDANEFLQTIIVYDPEQDKDGELAQLSSLFLKRILDVYLNRTSILSSSHVSVSPENDFVSHQLESILVTFGRKMPKIFLLALDNLFVQKHYRIQALNLLSAFVRLQPPHLHLVLETPLVQHLEKCLLTDASSTVIELALVVLIMFLPHICGALTSSHHLAKMFLIYSRVLCWDKLGTNEENKTPDNDAEEESQGEDDGNEGDAEQAWDPVQYSMEYPDSSPPTLMHYFTFLYGLFPLNFMSFVRKPRRYLKSLNFPGARDFDLDQDLIHSRTEPYRRVHLLHPNMFITTAEDELSENRWVKSDPADVVTECMDLCVAVASTLEDPGPPPNAALPAIPVPSIPEEPTNLSLDDDSTTANESKDSWRNTQSTLCVPQSDAPETFDIPLSSKSVKSAGSESPLLKGHEVLESSKALHSRDVRKRSFPAVPTAKIAKFTSPQPSLHNFAHTIASPVSPTNPNFQQQTLGSLQREIMLLRNDLNFERYLKLQHVAHIGQLQRKHIKEATAEAETQNLINTNKTLKAKLAKANELYAQLKKETLTSRNQSKKWETDLSAKVRSYRDGEKAWHSEEDGLRFELKSTQSDYEHLKKIVEKAEAEKLKAQRRTQALEFELKDYDNIRRDLEAAQEKIVSLEDQRKEVHTLLQERNELRNGLERANMRLNSREIEREQSIKAYERRIVELETRLQMAERNNGKPGQLPPSIQQMLDSALAASNAKLQQMKKTHYHLLEQHTELQMKFHDLEGERQSEKGRYQAQDRASISRSSGLSVRAAQNYQASRYLPSTSPVDALREELEHHFDYGSSSPVVSPQSTASSAHASRYEHSPKPPKNPTTPLPYPNFGGSFGPDFSTSYNASVNSQLESPRQGNATQSSDQSSYSVDTEGSGGREKKDKVAAKSEVRVYGRGGAQNIGKKVKDKDQKKAPSSKTGGFRGLKGIM